MRDFVGAPRTLGGRSNGKEVMREAPIGPSGGAAPTLFHVTHWKAASQWVNRIPQDLVFDLLVLAQYQDQDQFLRFPIQAGKIYPTVYVTRKQFLAVTAPADHRRFVIIRHPRDTLVSLYFSVRFSHAIRQAAHRRHRDALRERDHEAGLLYVLENVSPQCAAIQESWLREVVLANRFERLTGGRRRGQEDVTAHERKGAAGDGRDRFTPRVKRAFKDRFGARLKAAGYAKDSDW